MYWWQLSSKIGGYIIYMSKDKLNELFEMQNSLDTYIIDQRNIQKSLDEWIVGLTIAMESEIEEIRKEVNWKWWKNAKEVNKDNLQEEIIDLWHFLLSMSIKAGLTSEDVYRIYVEKNQENFDRQNGVSQKDGYSLK
jgi:dimeric dUTPase (all-alpha-NTP-PPase superfamily)